MQKIYVKLLASVIDGHAFKNNEITRRTKSSRFVSEDVLLAWPRNVSDLLWDEFLPRRAVEDARPAALVVR